MDKEENIEISIQNLWKDMQNKHIVEINQNGNQMINIEEQNLYINSINGYVPIKRLFRHKVSKGCYKISTSLTEDLYITEDHSIMCKRNGEIIEISPKDITKNDFLIVNDKECKDYQIKRVQDFKNQNVYDIEVNDDSHTFYGNDILLHNSIYVKMDGILKKLFGTTEINWNDQQTFLKIKDYVDNTFQQKLNTYCADFICKKFFTDQKRIEFKRQKISAQGEYLAKKHYIVHVYDNEGLQCNKWAYAGVQIKKNEIPNSIKKLLKECVQGLIEEDWDNNKFQNKIREMYDIFNTMSIQDISYIKNLGTLKKVEGFLTLEKGSGAHVKAAEFYNQIIKELGITNKYEEIRQYDRFHYFYIKNTNKYGINVIGYKDRYPKEFNDLFQVDRDKMFEKAVLAPFKGIIKNHHYSTFNPTEVTILNDDGMSVFDL